VNVNTYSNRTIIDTYLEGSNYKPDLVSPVRAVSTSKLGRRSPADSNTQCRMLAWRPVPRCGVCVLVLSWVL